MSFQYLPWFNQQFHVLMQRYDAATFPQSMMIVGDQDIGKSIFANDLARSILCLQRKDDQACGHCQSCIWLDRESHPDFMSITSDEKSHIIKIDQIRHLIQFSQMTSETGRKVIIIHHADEMNKNAANALLKTLEEPVQNCYLILVTSYPKKLPITIASRCQFQLLSVDGHQENIARWLSDQHESLSESHLAKVTELSYGRPMLSHQFLSINILSIQDELDQLMVKYLHHKNNLEEVSSFMTKNWQYVSHIVLYWLVQAIQAKPVNNVVVQMLQQQDPVKLFNHYDEWIKAIELSMTNIKQEWLLNEWLIKL